jgi:hypothetical protein
MGCTILEIPGDKMIDKDPEISMECMGCFEETCKCRKINLPKTVSGAATKD